MTTTPTSAGSDSVVDTDPVVDTGGDDFAPPPHPHHSSALVGVEVALLDQYGDPGFVVYRGDFHTASAAVGFALTQAHHVITARELGRIAVTLTDHTVADPTGTGEDRLETLIGSVGEIACALAADPDYAAGVRRVELPPDSEVLSVITATETALGAIDDTADHGHTVDGDDGWFVHVCSVRPGPIPNSKAVIGPLVRARAESTAGLLAHRLGGDLTAHPDRGVITLRHHLIVGDEDEDAVRRYEQITAAIAAAATLHPDTGEHRRITADIRALSITAHHPGGHL